MGRLIKLKWYLLGCLTVTLVLIAGFIFIPGSLTNVVKLVANNNFVSQLRELPQRSVVQKDSLIEMVVERVGISKANYQPAVILKEKDGELYLPIWIGSLEANAISVVLEREGVYRPLTPDLLLSVIDSMEAKVDYIVIHDLWEGTFYANIALNNNWKQMQIDARPSDAIAIALRAKAPIYVEKWVLDEAGI